MRRMLTRKSMMMIFHMNVIAIAVFILFLPVIHHQIATLFGLTVVAIAIFVLIARMDEDQSSTDADNP